MKWTRFYSSVRPVSGKKPIYAPSNADFVQPGPCITIIPTLRLPAASSIFSVTHGRMQGPRALDRGADATNGDARIRGARIYVGLVSSGTFCTSVHPTHRAPSKMQLTLLSTPIALALALGGVQAQLPPQVTPCIENCLAQAAAQDLNGCSVYVSPPALSYPHPNPARC